MIPDRALSAGTVLAISGDAILMDYHSCMGPIDPQLERDGKLVPVLSYLVQYNRLIDKANNGTLTIADAILLEKLDLAELHQFELARDLERLGCERKADYRLAPALGGTVIRSMERQVHE